LQASKRDTIIELIENENIPREHIPKALHEAEIIPSAKAWYDFIDRLLLWLSGLALSFAVMFFVAFNWTALGRFGKFGMVEILLVVTIGMYWYLGREKRSAQVTLMAASILLGVLLALVGQTYQTGADPWELFFYWAILMLPWAWVGRFAPIWMVSVLLINISLVLYLDIYRGFFGFSIYGEDLVIWILFIFNTLVWMGWVFFSARHRWLDSTWSVRLLGFVSMLAITFLALRFFDNEHTSVLVFFIWMIFLGGIYWVYRVKTVDLFMLTLLSFSFSSVVIAFFIDIVSWRHFGLGAVLLIGLLILGLGAGFAKWLKSVQKEVNNANVA